MYSTVKDIHYSIELGVQRLVSNSNRTLTPPILDYYFNRNMLRFISTRKSSTGNPKQEGFDDTTKRVSDLQDIITSTDFLQAKIEDDNLTYVELPSDYKDFSSAKVKLKYNCKPSDIETKAVNATISVLPFLDDTYNSGTFYTNARIDIQSNSGITSVFNVNDYINLETLYSSEAKFMITNIITNLVNAPVEIYWERYGNAFHPNSFILVDFTNTYINSYISYTNFTSSGAFTLIDENTYDVETNLNKPVELVGSDKFDSLVENYYYSKNRHNKPLIKIEDGRLYIHNTNFYPSEIKLYYISSPIFINSFTGQMTNLRTNIEEIIDLTIEDIKLTLMNTAEADIRRNLKNE